ncbi:MAG: PrpF domain-containing protein, partial [Erysipelotrichaceae bacterium]|nr:PrpF domain-containing protein [Erysipelotrichaceae bacterium]
DGSIVNEIVRPAEGQKTVRIGHPSGVMTMVPTVLKHGPDMKDAEVPGVAVQRTARRIMDGYVYVRD